MKNLRLFLIPFLFLTLSSCSATQSMQTVSYVDLNRYMGKWFVIANIPTFLEKGVVSPTETYSLNPDGSIDTKFEFFDVDTREFKSYNPTGFVLDPETNAVWGMQFIWPFKADFRVIYLNEDYSATIIGRNKKDYVWLMARTPEISAELYEEMIRKVSSVGYDTSLIQKAEHDKSF